MPDLFSGLLDTSGFIPRRMCGDWSTGRIWLHVGSDLFIWLAYLSIPLILIFFARHRRNLPFRGLFLLFAAFILACGFTHFVESLLFHYPVYRLSGALKLITAVISWATVIALIPATPRAIAWLDRAVPEPIPFGQRSSSSFPSSEDRSRPYIVAILSGVLAVLLRHALTPLLLDDHPFVLCLFAVMFSAWYGGFFPGLATLAIGAVGSVFYFVPPYDSFSVVNYSNQLGVALFASLGVAAAMLGEAQRSARSQAEQALAKLEILHEEAALNAERFRLLVENLPLMIWTADADGAIRYLNEQWLDFTGQRVLSIDDPAWRGLIHSDDVERLDKDILEASPRGLSSRIESEVRIRRVSDGRYRWHRAAVLIVRDVRGDAVQRIGAFVDIHDQKLQAETLSQLVEAKTAELRDANSALQAKTAELGRSNEELEKFAYVASHDLQEPLRKIQAFGDRLATKQRDALGDQGKDYLDRILAAASRMRALINDLLSFSRVPTKGQPFVEVDLSQIAEGVLSDLEDRLSEAGGRAEVGDLPVILADPTQMRQVFQNLIANALKFRKPDVSPIVKMTSSPLSALPKGEPPSTLDVPGWRIRVEDNGIGFEQEYASRIFELFQRLHGREQYEGTGLGLAICRKIIERHGGTITALGRPGVGAAFQIDLPDRRDSLSDEPFNDEASQADHHPDG